MGVESGTDVFSRAIDHLDYLCEAIGIDDEIFQVQSDWASKPQLELGWRVGRRM